MAYPIQRPTEHQKPGHSPSKILGSEEPRLKLSVNVQINTRRGRGEVELLPLLA